MVAISFQQVDAAADSGANIGCSGAILATTPGAREIVDIGLPGTVEVTVDQGLNNGRAIVMFQTDTGGPEPGVTTWQSGDYVVRLNLTTSRSGVIWTESHICERTSGGVFNTVASLTGQTTSLNFNGVKTMTVNRGSDFSPLNDQSTLYIVIVVDGPLHGGSSWGFEPSVVIDTPIDDGVAAGLPPRNLTALQAVARMGHY